MDSYLSGVYKSASLALAVPKGAWRLGDRAEIWTRLEIDNVFHVSLLSFMQPFCLLAPIFFACCAAPRAERHQRTLELMALHVPRVKARAEQSFISSNPHRPSFRV